MIRSWLWEHRYSMLLAGAFIAVWLLLQFDAVHQLSAALVSDTLRQENIAYLEGAEQEAKDNFIKLSEIFAILQVIGSGEVGVSFFVDVQVTVGQTVAALTNIVEKGIAVSIAAASAAVALKGLVDFASELSPFLFKVILLLVAICLIAMSINREHVFTKLSYIFSEIGVILFLTVYLLIPYSIHATGWVSQHITTELKQESSTHLSHFHKEMTQTKTKKPSSLKDRGENAVHHLEKTIIHLPHKVEAMSVFLIRHLAASLIEGLLLPLGAFMILWFALRQILRYIRPLAI